jgi:hypothetical protein
MNGIPYYMNHQGMPQVQKENTRNSYVDQIFRQADFIVLFWYGLAPAFNDS